MNRLSVLKWSQNDDVLEAFTKMDQDQTIKKIRYLESADLHFEKVHVVLDKVGDSVEHEPNLAQVVSFLDRSRPILEIEDFYVWVEQFPTPTITHLHNIMEALKNSKAIGLTLSEICHAVTLPADTVLPLLMDLNDTQQVLACGVDEHRWVSIEFEHVWTIGINGRKWCPRLWISPEGAISLPVVRWIAESTLLTIVGKPGILLKDVLFTYEFVLQPVSVQEIIDLLEHFKCIVVMRKEFASSKLASPFGG
uniref:Uncharacterized protein n=2 Tax=Caenorhabditis japonica TaxID=281687 RepID=A0A8R1IJ40_CAEJA